MVAISILIFDLWSLLTAHVHVTLVAETLKLRNIIADLIATDHQPFSEDGQSSV